MQNSIPAGYGTVTPWIIVKGAAALIAFLENAFGAVEKEGSRFTHDDGTIGHVEVQIGDSVVMLFDAKPNWPPTPAFMRLYVEDGDATYRQALLAGAESITKMSELSFGGRVGRVRDPFGNVWWIQQHDPNITMEEMQQHAGEAAYIEAMQYVQNSLDEAMSGEAVR